MQPLFFTPDTVKQAQSERTQPPLSWAWAWLTAESEAIIRERPAPTLEDKHATAPVLKPILSAFGQVQAWATHYAFTQEEPIGARACQQLGAVLLPEATTSTTEMLMHALASLQVITLLSTHPQAHPSAWLAQLYEHVQPLLASPSDSVATRLWQEAFRMGWAVLHEDDSRLNSSIEAYQQAIATIHPEGYLKPAVEIKGVEAFHGQFLACGALVLMAEMGQTRGLSLWNYETRGVSLSTAVSYCVYYYFFPEKWTWGGALTLEDTQPIVKAHGAFLEIANHRVTLLRGIDILLDDNRPFYSPYAGGLATLSHGMKRPEPKKKGGWLWSR